MPSLNLAENTDRLSENHCVNFLDGLIFVSIVGITSKLSAEEEDGFSGFGQPAIFALNTVPELTLNPGSSVTDLAAL